MPSRIKKATSDCTVIVGGGSRGLGKALWDSIDTMNHDVILLHHGRSEQTATNIPFDADYNDSIYESLRILLAQLEVSKYKRLDFHVVLGGAMGVPDDCTDILLLERVFRHNVLIPSIFFGQILQFFSNHQNSIRINAFLYSSSVAVNDGSTFLYNSAKLSLENYFKTMVKKYSYQHNLFLIRIGVMNIEHKYFHQLRDDDPDAFNQLVERLIPSRHFTEPREIYQMILTLKTLSSICNGTIIDVSGGHSWT